MNFHWKLLNLFHVLSFWLLSNQNVFASWADYPEPEFSTAKIIILIWYGQFISTDGKKELYFCDRWFLAWNPLRKKGTSWQKKCMFVQNFCWWQHFKTFQLIVLKGQPLWLHWASVVPLFPKIILKSTNIHKKLKIHQADCPELNQALTFL